MTRQELINKALMVSDKFGIIQNEIDNVQTVKLISLYKFEYKAVINLSDDSVIVSTMRDSMLKRAIDTVKRNKKQILEYLKHNNKHS